MVTKAQYIISSPDVAQCPQTNLPEYAFIGRSNVGKSSLINMLCHQKNLAKTSQKPGKTLLINHFSVTSNDREWRLVDLPASSTLALALCPHRLPPRAAENRPRVHGVARRERSTLRHGLHQR